MNSLEKKCKGKITRRRIINKVKEENIIDFVIVCDEMEDMISNVVIDEDKNHVLTRHTKTKNGVKIKESDHMSIITEVKLAWDKSRNTEKIEMYNFKDAEGLTKFKKMTSQDNFLSEVFDDPNKNMNVKTKQFIKRFGYCLSHFF